MAARQNKTERFMVEELRREREASSLNISELTTFVDAGEMLSERRKQLCKPACINNISGPLPCMLELMLEHSIINVGVFIYS